MGVERLRELMLTTEELLGAIVERLCVRPAILPGQRVGLVEKLLGGFCRLGVAARCQMAESKG